MAINQVKVDFSLIFEAKNTKITKSEIQKTVDGYTLMELADTCLLDGENVEKLFTRDLVDAIELCS